MASRCSHGRGACPALSLRASAHTGVAIRFLLAIRSEERACSFQDPFLFLAIAQKEKRFLDSKEKKALKQVFTGCGYIRRPNVDAWCGRVPLSRCLGTVPGFRPAPTGGCQAAAVSFPTLGRAASEGAGTAERPADSCAGAVPSLTLRATVARTSLREQEEGCRGIFLPPFVRCADISPAGGIFPAAFLLGCKTLFFPRRKEKGFS